MLGLAHSMLPCRTIGSFAPQTAAVLVHSGHETDYWCLLNLTRQTTPNNLSIESVSFWSVNCSAPDYLRLTNALFAFMGLAVMVESDHWCKPISLISYCYTLAVRLASLTISLALESP